MSLDNGLSNNESATSRRNRDSLDEQQIKDQLTRFYVFIVDRMPCNTIENIVTKDISFNDITHDLLDARQIGQGQLVAFVQKRSIMEDCGKPSRPFSHPLKKCKALTFASLYKVQKQCSSKDHTIKADRSTLQRLLIALEAGRKVNLPEILSHELLPVPLSLSKMDGSLRAGQKLVLTAALTKVVNCPKRLQISEQSTLIISD